MTHLEPRPGLSLRVRQWLDDQVRLDRTYLEMEYGNETGSYVIEGTAVTPVEACLILGAPDYVMEAFSITSDGYEAPT